MFTKAVYAMEKDLAGTNKRDVSNCTPYNIQQQHVFFFVSGVMIWSIDTDDFHNLCGGGKFGLISILQMVLNGGFQVWRKGKPLLHFWYHAIFFLALDCTPRLDDPRPWGGNHPEPHRAHPAPERVVRRRAGLEARPGELP